MALPCKHVDNISPHDKAVLSQIFRPGFPTGDSEEKTQEERNETVVDETIKKAKILEVEGVKAAEAGELDEAIDCFSRAVITAPQWASAYNNRAQALRLKGDIKGALDDLNMAVVLSKGEGKAACQALTQRGIIRRLEGYTEAALEDFKAAAHLGSEFAKHMLVALNPYAALCNQMLGEVMAKLRAGEQ